MFLGAVSYRGHRDSSVTSHSPSTRALGVIKGEKKKKKNLYSFLKSRLSDSEMASHWLVWISGWGGG